jgi:hypothetical protein
MAFERHIAAFTEALGVENAPTIIYMSLVPWPNDDARNEFIKNLTNIDMREMNTYG